MIDAYLETCETQSRVLYWSQES